MVSQPTNFELRVFFDVVNRLAMFEAQHRANGKGMFSPQELPVVEVPKVMQWLDYIIQNNKVLVEQGAQVVAQPVFVPQFQQVQPVTGEQPPARKKPGPKPKPRPGQPGYVDPAATQYAPPTSQGFTAPPNQYNYVAPPVPQQAPPTPQGDGPPEGFLKGPEDPTFVTEVKPGQPFDYTQEVAGQVLIIPDEQPQQH